MRTVIAIVTTAVLAAGAFAQGGPGEGEQFDIEAALRRIHKLMREAEISLIESLDSQEAAEKSRKAREEIEKLLGAGRKKGKDIVDEINVVLENLPQGGGGGGQSQQKPKPEDGKPKPEEGQDVKSRDPKNSKNGEPESPEKTKSEEDAEKAKKPPTNEAKEKVEVDPAQEWLARLPPQVRQDILNGNFERVPPKWKPLIEAWFKKMADIDDD